ncbi:CGNR zinc finger domain-containing protein [Nitratireductor luteus]|uniref:CGNR zinc finger domain-containing protein n=1 Tax=Nitratireductor luteus TaxID=2976980 RepID=UPI002240AA75|nr:ABATE domain-containing protein [Nitratireductor luteus]
MAGMEGPVPFFFGGRLCLDFVNTVNSRSRPATKDYLPDYSSLTGWCRQTGALDAPTLSGLNVRAASEPAASAAAHREAIALREALYRVFRAAIVGPPSPPQDLALLNHWLREARSRQVLAERDSGFEWRWEDLCQELLAPLMAVAVSAGALLAGDDLKRLKDCPEPEGCGWLFYDETRNSSRRWCSMDHCGGAAKARRYAARHGTAVPGRKSEAGQ